MSGPLSEAELKAYRDNGFVIPEFRLGPDEVAELQAIAARLIADNPELANKVIAAAHIASDGSTACGVRSDGSLLKYATQPRLLDMMEQLIGPDMILWTTSVFHKAALSGPATPWHQDTRYWPMSPLTNANYWIAITESTPENACMRVVPGTHRALVPHVKSDGKSEFALTLDLTAFDENAAVDVVLEPGQMLVFDAQIAHSSHPNNGMKVRTGFAARFIPSTSHFNHDFEYAGKVGYADRALMLVRGEDKGGNDLARNWPTVAA